MQCISEYDPLVIFYLYCSFYKMFESDDYIEECDISINFVKFTAHISARSSKVHFGDNFDYRPITELV